MKGLKNIENAMLVLCLGAEAMAYVYALLFRYVLLNWYYTNPTRENDFYKLFGGILLFLYWAVFLYRKKKRAVVWEQDNWDRALEVFKHHITMIITVVIFLFFIGWSARISRTVLALTASFGMIFDLVIRWQFGERVARRRQKTEKIQQVVLIACEEESERLRWCIERYGYNNEWKEIHSRCKVVQTVTPQEWEPAAEADMIYLSDRAKRMLKEEQLQQLEGYGIPLCSELKPWAQSPGTDMVVKNGGNAVLFRSLMNRRSPVLGVNYTTANITEVASYLISHSAELGGKYICFSNVHTTVMAADQPEYKEILNGSAMTFPDGMPIAKKIRQNGYYEAERVAGPDLMEELFRQSMGSGKKHYFYGSTETTVEKLKERLSERFPWMEIVGMVSPPFRELTEEEDDEAVRQINESGADFVWIGLGAPKQERWMKAHAGKIHAVMLGVGAGFDFHAGTIRRAPRIIQKLGLEWLYRLFQNPGRLFRRYFVTNIKFFLYTKLKSKR